MDLQAIRMLYDYNYTARDRIWRCVAALSEEQYCKSLDYSVGSIHEQVVHMMAAEHIWFSRLSGHSPERLWNGSDFPDREAVWAKWAEVDKMVRGYLAELDEDTLQRDLYYKKTSGEQDQTPVMGVLLHVVNHATDHRAQTLAMIHQLGGDTLSQDLIHYLRDQTTF